MNDGEGVLLPHSLLVEGLSRPLISVPTLDKQGYGFLTLSEHAHVLKGNEIIMRTPLGALPDAPNLYGVPLDWFVNADQHIAAAAEALLSKTTTNVEADFLRFHRAIGHRNMRETTRLYNELLSGTLPYDFAVDCDSCPAAKMTKTSFAKQYRIKATHVGHTLSFDGYGPYKILSPSRDRSGLVVVDNNSKYIFHSMHKYRSEYGPQCRWTVLHAINVHGRVCYTRSDNEFVTNENKDLFQAKGIQALPTAPASSESNGQAERTIRTIRESGRAMRHTANAPPSWQLPADHYAAYVLNYLPRKNETRMSAKEPSRALSPVELWQKTDYGSYKNLLGHIRVFGCECWAHKPPARPTRSIMNTLAKPPTLAKEAYCMASMERAGSSHRSTGPTPMCVPAAFTLWSTPFPLHARRNRPRKLCSRSLQSNAHRARLTSS